MPIKRLLAGYQLEPEEVEILTAAFNRALRSLDVVDRNDPRTDLIAREIIEIGATGVRDPVEISKIAIKRLSISVFHSLLSCLL
jgi:hypothetical protein